MAFFTSSRVALTVVCFGALLAVGLLLPGSAAATTVTYDFTSDTVGQSPANVTLRNGSAQNLTVVNDATLASNAVQVAGNFTKATLDNVPITSDSIDANFRAKLSAGDQNGVLLFSNTTAETGYLVHWDSASDNRIELYKVSGTHASVTLTSLANDATPIPTTTDFKWRVTATVSGSSTTITVYSWNGSTWVSELAHTDASSAYQTGTFGLYHTNTNAMVMDDIAVTYTETPGITLSSPSDYQIFQRNGSNQASIAISGTYVGSPTAIEARWNGGGWATIDDTLSGGTYSGTLSNQAQGQGTLEVRFSNDTAVTDSAAYVGIGDIFVIAGQSNGSGRGTNNQTYSHATLKASKHNGSGWLELSDPTASDSGAAGSIAPLLATKYMADKGIPVGFSNVSVGGTAISAWQKGQGNYTTLTNRINLVGGSIKAVLWWQGEFEAGSATTQATYQTLLSDLADDIFADFGVSTVVAQIGYYRDANTTGINNVRLAQSESWGTGNILAGPTLYDVSLVDSAGVHFTTDAEMDTAGDRWWAAINKSVYSSGVGRGPQFASAIENEARTAITVTFTGDALPLLPDSGLSSSAWRVEDDGVSVSISSVTRPTTSTIQINLASVLTGAVTVSLGYGNTGSGATVPTDSSSDPLPAEVFITQDATPPLVETLSPADGATGVSPTANLVITFNTTVTAAASKNIIIKKSSDDSTVETIAANGGQVSISGATVTINPASTLADTTSYYVTIDAGAFEDAVGNDYYGISSSTAWNFTTADTTAPTVSTFSPADDATSVALTNDLIMTFGEDVTAASGGTITIKKSSDDSTVETIAADGGLVSVSGNTATITPSTTLNYATAYYITVSAGSFTDSSSNNFAGITAATTWNFTTINAPAAPSQSNEGDGGKVSGEASLQLGGGTTIDSQGRAVTPVTAGSTVVLTVKVPNADEAQAVYVLIGGKRIPMQPVGREGLYTVNLGVIYETTAYTIVVDYGFIVHRTQGILLVGPLPITSAPLPTLSSRLVATVGSPLFTPTEEFAEESSVVSVEELDTPSRPKELLAASLELVTNFSTRFNEWWQRTSSFLAGLFTRTPALPAELKDHRYERVTIKLAKGDGTPLAGAHVTLFSEPRTTVTDQQGVATFADVPAGAHTLAIAHGDQRSREKLFLAAASNEVVVDVNAELRKGVSPFALLGAVLVSALLGTIVGRTLSRRNKL